MTPKPSLEPTALSQRWPFVCVAAAAAQLVTFGQKMMSHKDDYFCPMPMKWNEAYTSLLRVWEEAGRNPKDKPPVPLILAAWPNTPGFMKLLRWKETIAWAEKHNCPHLIPDMKEEGKFRG